MINKKQIVEECRKYFETKNIDFVYLFGSFADGSFNKMSDIDLAVHYRQEPVLTEMGMEIYGLEKILKCDIDLIVLNDLFLTKPGFVYNIISQGELILNKNNIQLIEYRTRCYINYFDTQYLRTQTNNALLERITSKTFALKG